MITTTNHMGYHTVTEDGNDVTFRNHQQSWYYTEIRAFGPSGIHKHFRTKIRVVIRRNYYDEQSYARLEVWATDGGWNIFHEQGIESLPVVGIIPSMRLEDVEQSFYDSAEHLWTMATEYLVAGK